MNKQEIITRCNKLNPWPVSIYLGHGVWTAYGVNMIKTNWYVNTVERWIGGFEGKRLLDIGSNTGYVAAEAALRGAKEVVAIEPHPSNYERCKLVFEARGLDNVTLTKDDMEKITKANLGAFDAIFFCGTVYHCSEPWNVIKKYADMTDVVLCESRLGAKFNEKKGNYQFQHNIEKAGSVLHRVETGSIRKPSRRTLFQMFQDAGFNHIHQLMPVKGLTPKYQKEECITYIADKRGFPKLKVEEEFDGGD